LKLLAYSAQVVRGGEDMPIAHDTERADRLLAKMHRVLTHDLPNQIVAVQSLLQLLEVEEASRLGDEGRECVGRLHRVARKANGMVRFLKEMGRLNTYQCRVEEISAAALLRELKAEVQQQLPKAPVEFQLATEVKTVTVDPRRLVLAVVEILRCLLERFAGSQVLVQLRGQRCPQGIELCGVLTGISRAARSAYATDAAAIAARTERARPERARPEQSLEIMLAEEMLAIWGAHLMEVREDADHSHFTVVVPA
jgi:hypothetical protein